MFRRALVLGAAFSLSACSLLLGEGFTDPNAEPQPANDSGGGADGASGGADGGDGSTTTPAADAGGDTAIDPGSDGGSDGACPVATVSFCDDFERQSPSDVKGAWDLIDVNASGSLAIVPSASGHHLATSVSATGGQAQLGKELGKQPSKVHFELSLTVKAFASTGGVYVAGFAMSNGFIAPSLVYLFVNTSTLYFVQQVADGGGYVGRVIPITLGTKHRLVVDLTLNGKVTVTVDGNSKVDENAQTFLVPNPVGAYLGASSIDALGDDGSFEIDDYVFTAD